MMALPVYFLLLTWPETTPALNERERYIAVNRFGRGATRHTDVSWDTHAFLQIFSRPSTYMFFASYVKPTVERALSRSAGGAARYALAELPSNVCTLGALLTLCTCRYICILIVATSLGSFLPIILNQVGEAQHQSLPQPFR